MSAYIIHLNALAERHDAESAADDQEIEAARERLTPLETRLEKLLLTIPDEIQTEGLSLMALQSSLKGRWRGACHPGELGAALRKLGYVRRRRWTGESGFRAVWYPTKA